MKILKIAALVTGIHVFALILIFANPGCSSSTKPPPAPSDTAASAPAPAAPATTAPGDGAGFSPAPIAFDPNAPAIAPSGGGGVGVRLPPIRPNTAVASAVVAEPVADVTPATTYVVMSGDSLWTIAKKSRLTVAEIAAANNLKTSAVLQPGQKLIIPGKPASPSVAAAANPGGGGSARATSSTAVTAGAPRPAGDALKHTVRSGETLSQIAKQYGVSQRELGVANHISDPSKLQAGTELVIPGWTTAGKAAKSGQKAGAEAAKKSPPTLNIEEPTPKSDIPVIKPEDSIFTPAPKK